MTVPLDMRNDIRAMDADGVARAEIARRLSVSRNTVAKYADMEDMSPAAPLPAERRRPPLEGHEAWAASVLVAERGHAAALQRPAARPRRPGRWCPATPISRSPAITREAAYLAYEGQQTNHQKPGRHTTKDPSTRTRGGGVSQALP